MTDDLEDRIAELEKGISELEATVKALRYRLEWQETLSGMHGDDLAGLPMAPGIRWTGPFTTNGTIAPPLNVISVTCGDPDGSAS